MELLLCMLPFYRPGRARATAHAKDFSVTLASCLHIPLLVDAVPAAYASKARKILGKLRPLDGWVSQGKNKPSAAPIMAQVVTATSSIVSNGAG